MRHAPPEDTTYLYLIRHGATNANEQRPYILQGDGIDLPLSPTGERQAAALGQFFREFPLNHVYCSTLRRAAQTAEAIAAPHGIAVESISGLSECNVGQWEGMDWETIRTRFPEECARFHEDPSVHPYLGGESYADVLRRAQGVLGELLERHRGQSVVVVSHSVVNRAYLSSLLGIELRRAKELRQQNACVNFIHHNGEGTKLLTLNSVFHLDEMPLW